MRGVDLRIPPTNDQFPIPIVKLELRRTGRWGRAAREAVRPGAGGGLAAGAGRWGGGELTSGEGAEASVRSWSDVIDLEKEK